MYNFELHIKNCKLKKNLTFNTQYKIKNIKYRLGFTLIEIIVSLGVFAVGILGVMALFPVGLDAQKRALDYSNLVGLAEWKMGDIAYRSHLSGSQNSLTADTSYPTATPDPEPFTHNEKYAWHYDVSQPFVPLTNLYRVDLYIYAIDNNNPFEKVVSYFELPE